METQSLKNWMRSKTFQLNQSFNVFQLEYSDPGKYLVPMAQTILIMFSECWHKLLLIQY
jgi:hypothetical protein